MIRFILPPIRTFSTGNQTLNRYLDSLRDGISSLSKIVNNASASVGPTGAIWWYNPGPATVEKGLLYGLDASGNTYVPATGLTASVIQPLFVAAQAIPPNTFGWAWANGPAEVEGDGGTFALGAAVWLSATAGQEGRITTTRPVGQTQFQMGWVTDTTLTPDSLRRVWLLPQPKRT